MGTAIGEPNQADRDRVIAALSDAFANGAIEVEELERRVAEAQHAVTTDQLARLWPGARAGGAAGGALALRPGAEAASGLARPFADAALVPAEAVKPTGRMISVLGNNRRAGTWTPPRQMRVTAVLGNAELDFREARMPAGPVEITVVGAFGNVDILVPPALPVEVEGLAVLGNFDHVDRVPASPDPEAPLLRIRGVAVFGNVDVKMRLPGETERDANLRRQGPRRGRP
ncbi:MAG TPA: DUF1707 domain-containing protein [Polyangia bacterium]